MSEIRTEVLRRCGVSHVDYMHAKRAMTKNNEESSSGQGGSGFLSVFVELALALVGALAEDKTLILI